MSPRQKSGEGHNALGTRLTHIWRGQQRPLPASLQKSKEKNKCQKKIIQKMYTLTPVMPRKAAGVHVSNVDQNWPDELNSIGKS